MTVDLKKLNGRIYRVITKIGRCADEHQIKAFIVGGVVRDFFLDQPNSDIDIVVEASAPVFARHLTERFKAIHVRIHHQFGTATVEGLKGVYIDIVSARGETYPYPGALPSVFRSGLKDDLFRRDFTINALAICINKNHFGDLIDYCDGLKDLRKGIIRVFHDQSFVDDPTRILRAVRFEQRFGFKFFSKTRQLLRTAIREHFERTVSSPRYFNEFVRGLEEEDPGRYLVRLKNLEAMDFLGKAGQIRPRILQGLGEALKVPVAKRSFKKIFFLAGLFSCCTKDEILDCGNKFQWPREEKKQIIAMVGSWHHFNELKEKGKQKEFLNSCSEVVKYFIQIMTAVNGMV
ncbi:MAG: hypothetical protein AB1650_05150 [Candidatus Omnitrophota bacterium]